MKSWVPRRVQIESNDCPCPSTRVRGHPMTSASGRLQTNKKGMVVSVVKQKNSLSKDTVSIKTMHKFRNRLEKFKQKKLIKD